MKLSAQRLRVSLAALIAVLVLLASFAVTTGGNNTRAVSQPTSQAAATQANIVLVHNTAPVRNISPARLRATGFTWKRTATSVTPYKNGARPARGSARWWGIIEIQRLLRASGIRVNGQLQPVTGVYGPTTVAFVEKYQKRHGLRVDGRVTYPVMKSLMRPIVQREARRVKMPAWLLMCHLAAESNLDPGAVGPNGSDIGIEQIALTYNRGVTLSQGFSPWWGTRYMAERDAKAFKRFRNWKLAVDSYNRPADAVQWQRTGKPNARAKAYTDRIYGGC